MRNQGVGRTGNAVAISALHYRWLILAFAIPAVLLLMAGFPPRRLSRRRHEPEREIGKETPQAPPPTDRYPE